MTLSALALSPAPHRFVTGGQGVDRQGGAIVSLIKACEISYLIHSTGWRVIDSGDGLSAVSTTIGTHVFTAGGTGYLTTGPGGASDWSLHRLVANSITNTNAWVCLGEFVNGVATGAQITISRSSQTTAGGERGLNVMVTPTPCTGTPTATSPRTTGGTQRYVLGSVGGAGAQNVWNYLLSANVTVCWQTWVGQKAVNGRVGLGIAVWGSSNASYGGSIWYLPLSEAGAGDPYPFVVVAGPWADTLGGTTTYTTAPTWASATGTAGHALDASGVWRAACGANTVDASSSTRPGTPAQVIRPDYAGKYWLVPLWVTLDNVSASAPEPKGKICDAFKTAWVADAAHKFPATLHSSVLDVVEPARILMGQFAVPGEVGASPPWTSSTNLTTFASLANDANPDTVPPVMGTFTPTPGAVPYDQVLTFPVPTDLVQAGRYVVTVQYAAHPDEVAWDGAAASSDYSSSSFPSSGTVSLSRDAGWPANYTVKVQAVDAAGNWATPLTGAYTISTTPNPAAPDSTAPTVGPFSPVSGSSIAYDDPVEFDVSDDRALGFYVVTVALEDGLPAEVVWDGEELSEAYSGSSCPDSGTVIIIRDDGWPSDFELRVTAVDESGLATRETAAFAVATSPNPASPDIESPTVELVTPTSLANLGRFSPVVLSLGDNRGIEYYAVFAVFPELKVFDLVLDGADLDLETNYQVTLSTVSGRQHAEILPRAGWPLLRNGARAEGFIRVRAIDARGNQV